VEQALYGTSNAGKWLEYGKKPARQSTSVPKFLIISKDLSHGLNGCM
jgi:hypothetical protein